MLIVKFKKFGVWIGTIPYEMAADSPGGFVQIPPSLNRVDSYRGSLEIIVTIFQHLQCSLSLHQQWPTTTFIVCLMRIFLSEVLLSYMA